MKKKNLVINEKFTIPQIDDKNEGLKIGRPEFVKSTIASPYFGKRVTDVMLINDSSGSVDIDNTYDVFRPKHEQKLTDEVRINKFGSKYHEFKRLNEQKREEIFGKSTYETGIKRKKSDGSKVVDTKKVEEQKTVENSFITDLKKPDIKPTLDNSIFEDFKTNTNMDKKPSLKTSIDDEFIFLNDNKIDNDIKEESQILDIKKEEHTIKEEKENTNFESKKINDIHTSIKNDIFNDDSMDDYGDYVDDDYEYDDDEFDDEDDYDEDDELDDYDDDEEEDDELDDYDNDSYNESNLVNKQNIIKKEVKTLSYDYYKLPPIDIFKKSDIEDDSIPEYVKEKKDVINQLLEDFNIDGEVVTYTKGPTFTRYEIMLSAGVKVNKVMSLKENLQMELGAKSIRILAPIPGKKTVGIEVPNDSIDTVYFGDIVDEDFVNDNKPLRVAFGKDIDGNSIYKNIVDMPHGLVAGATKSGKSVCVNTMLISLLIKNKPDDLKLILIDPKKVELSFYEDLPHLITPVVTDSIMASECLKWAVDEMERRYEILLKARVRNIDDYNTKAKEDSSLIKMPFIVIVIDELADLKMTASADVEDSITRITQKARAAGIHLVVATQRPSVQIVSGTIKANIPTRIAFKVSSYVDSNTILDEAGAEALLGKGDMLIKDNDSPVRLQGAYISDNEINKVCDFIRNQADPDFIFTHEELKSRYENNFSNYSSGQDAFESESFLYDIARSCLDNGNASINNIQGSFQIGFNRAQKIIQILEQRGVVGPKAGTKGRTILVTLDELNKMFGKSE